MGKDFYEEYEESKKIYDLAAKILGTDIKKICFNQDTTNEYTQLAIFITEMAILEVIKKLGIKAEYTSGLSLGEYGALTYANVITLEDAIPLIKKRGEYMYKYIEPGEYKMVAIIGLNRNKVLEICDSVNGFIKPVNYNCPGQIVVSGDAKIIEESIEIFKNEGASKVIELNTNSAFHTTKLNKARDIFYEELKNIDVKNPVCGVIKNTDGLMYTKNDDVRKILADHIVMPVRFEDGIRNMIEEGVDIFIEIGPGKILSGFVKRISKDVNVFNISTVLDLEKLKEDYNVKK